MTFIFNSWLFKKNIIRDYQRVRYCRIWITKYKEFNDSLIWKNLEESHKILTKPK